MPKSRYVDILVWQRKNNAIKGGKKKKKMLQIKQIVSDTNRNLSDSEASYVAMPRNEQAKPIACELWTPVFSFSNLSLDNFIGV